MGYTISPDLSTFECKSFYRFQLKVQCVFHHPIPFFIQRVGIILISYQTGEGVFLPNRNRNVVRVSIVRLVCLTGIGFFLLPEYRDIIRIPTRERSLCPFVCSAQTDSLSPLHFDNRILPDCYPRMVDKTRYLRTPE